MLGGVGLGCIYSELMDEPAGHMGRGGMLQRGAPLGGSATDGLNDSVLWELCIWYHRLG